MNIQWYPGHMTKTRRMMEADIKLVDAVAELVDARCPEASRNPILDELIGGKARIIILNKSDYANNDITAQWKKHYEERGAAVLICDCRSGKGVNYFVPLLKKKLSEILERRIAKGIKGQALRVMVAGIPNVGKSSFINRMANSRKTKVGDKPGITRGKQWVTIDKQIELLDTPGILWHKFDDPEAAKKLAFTGAVKDEVMDIVTLADELILFLQEHCPGALNALQERYNAVTLEGIAIGRKMLITGGQPDIERAANTLLDEFRGGKLGKVSLEKP
ncbi:MAG: ribosome biogenesis GTPase YlqF [Oscillospiraceae bacterium]|nr:ribosome biogenesis GTPase YlqF [Oscillospiraceae bacterium]